MHSPSCTTWCKRWDVCPLGPIAPGHSRHYIAYLRGQSGLPLRSLIPFVCSGLCCLGFAALLCSGEFTCPSVGAYDLSMLSMLVDSHTSLTLLVVRLRHSKTDIFGTRVSLYVGATGSPNCPVAAVLAYMSICPPQPEPIFIKQDGRPLSLPALVAGIHRALVSAGVDVSRVSGHIFRIGAATTAARAELSDFLIQTLGRWGSSAFCHTSEHRRLI